MKQGQSLFCAKLTILSSLIKGPAYQVCNYYEQQREFYTSKQELTVDIRLYPIITKSIVWSGLDHRFRCFTELFMTWGRYTCSPWLSYFSFIVSFFFKGKLFGRGFFLRVQHHTQKSFSFKQRLQNGDINNNQHLLHSRNGCKTYIGKTMRK